MNYPITYLYTLKKNSKIFYVGKTRTPNNRFRSYCSKIKEEFIMEIVHSYIDEEDKFIIKLVSENNNIDNIHVPRNTEGEFEIGTKFYSKQIKNKAKQIFDKKLNKIWPSLKECSLYYGVEYYIISSYLKGNTTTINDLLDLEYINN